MLENAKLFNKLSKNRIDESVKVNIDNPFIEVSGCITGIWIDLKKLSFMFY